MSFYRICEEMECCMEFLELATWIAIGKIIVVDILLAGDNAVVIGMAVSKLRPELQKRAILWGTFGAIALRFLFATILMEALSLIPALHLIGGLVLLWISIHLLKGDEEDANIESKDSLRGAIITIIMADAMMSIDNVLGVVAAAGGHLEFVIVGMLITVPLLIFGSAIFAKVIERYPLILWAGGSLLGWVSGEMIVEDPLLIPYIDGYQLAIKIAAVIFVVVVALLIRKSRKKA